MVESHQAISVWLLILYTASDKCPVRERVWVCQTSKHYLLRVLLKDQLVSLILDDKHQLVKMHLTATLKIPSTI